MSSNPIGTREQQAQMRALLPKLEHLVENVAPQAWKDAAESRADRVPDWWKTKVADMRSEVHRDSDGRPQADLDAPAAGREWSYMVDRVGDMLNYLWGEVGRDLGFDLEHEAMASVILMEKALAQVVSELRDGSAKDGDGTQDENRYRVLQALKALTPKFDDLNLKKLRALQVGTFGARTIRVPNAAEVEQLIRNILELGASPTEKDHRKWFSQEQPLMCAVSVRQFLAEVDERFGTLDPLVVLEEFSEADHRAQGGRARGGEGRGGPARAVARLALRCGALDYRQEDGEDFDQAVDRVRDNLLVARSRVRGIANNFPGEVEASPEEEPPVRQ